MGCACITVVLFLLLTAGYYQFYTQYFGWAFGIENEDAYNDDPYGTELDGEELDPVRDEDYWEDKTRDGIGIPQKPVNLRARLDRILSGPHYKVFHDISFIPVGEQDPVRIDHLVVSPLGLFLIRTIDRDGGIDTCLDDDEWWWMQDMELELFPSPRHEIKHIARQFATIHTLDTDKVIGVVASTGRAFFEGEVPPDVRYAKDLPKELWPLSRANMSPRDLNGVYKWLVKQTG